MRLIKPSYKIIEQEPGINGVYKMIEYAGRVCYKSEDKITEDSAKGFVDRMVKSGHGAMLEQGTVYLKVTYKNTDFATLCMFYGRNKYSVLNHSYDNKIYYITTNYRVLVENNHLSDLKYLCEPTEFHAKRITVHFVCDRGVSHEFVRHRVMSFAQESTRYCNYSKDKFGNQLTFIKPNWLDIPEDNYTYWNGGWFNDKSEKIQIEETAGTGVNQYLSFLSNAEMHYKLLLHKGWTPQQARAVLPNSLKTELVVTGFVSDWKHFFGLRAIGTTGAPHPQAKELAEPLMEEFITRKYINN